MTDIVERLRDASYANAPSRCMEAAREIERLREQVARREEQFRLQAAEIERLRAALDSISAFTTDQVAECAAHEALYGATVADPQEGERLHRAMLKQTPLRGDEQ